MRLRGKPESFVRISDSASQQDVEMEEAPAESTELRSRFGAPVESTQERSGTCLVIAIDFGTTFSSVGFRRTDDIDRKLDIQPKDIECIKRFPYDPSQYSVYREEVPTESWYSGKPRDGRNEHLVDSSDESTASDHLESDGEGQETDAILDLPVYDSDDGDASAYREEYLWGYSVQRNLGPCVTDLDRKLRIARSKLMLDNSMLTAEIRAGLHDSTSVLKQKRYIKKDTDVIIDFLTRLLQHTKSQLMLYHNFDESVPVEFVVCIPVAWKGSACRKMQTAVTQAVKRATFSSLSDTSIQNMFMVSEPEAAAACVLSGSNNVEAGEAFLLLDAGGGTVDATTFIVEKGDPLRLKREGVEPDARLCGSSILNKHYEKLLNRKLMSEKDYLESDGVSLRRIIDDCVQDFENVVKRNYDIMAKERPFSVFVQGLRTDQEKGFVNQHLKISRQEMNEVFMECLKPIAEMMRKQLDLAKENGLEVEKVVLIGGFAGSPSLQNYLKHVLYKMQKIDGQRRCLMTPAVPGTAVAQGAVLRALRKEDGPDRISGSSYGWLRTEPYHGSPEMKAAHDSVIPDVDPLDGDEYVRDTIDWFIKKDDLIPSEEIYNVPVLYTFPTNRPKLLCKEVLYVADHRLESHYKRRDKKNRGAAVAGSILVDMTFLKVEGHIVPTVPDTTSPGKPHYKVEFELVIIVSGRSLRYEARWPRGSGCRVIEAGQICIAAAFQSGTS